MKKFNIAIDGPSSSGKSTIAKRLAKLLNFVHIDTGAMYRALGVICSDASLDLKDEEACFDYVKNVNIQLTKEGSIFVDGKDYTRLIRSAKASDAASKISVHPKIRKLLVEKQQDMAKDKGFVMDGRDITSVVLPDAEIKIFQTADLAVRAQRRYEELLRSNPDLAYDDVFNDLQERDWRDSNRTASPTTKVDDAIEIDSSHLSIDEVVNLILNIIESRGLS